ncbi:hypothetical protein ACTQ33_15390 [Candidatus Avoscillospira sp. LCP25S3_F1]|uniref:hypothetical protein n=1 Tax=Candidatus Avoscillospira sp. LCP25S3_F1 TaxID=3438825 RepID=UPI003F8F3A6C
MKYNQPLTPAQQSLVEQHTTLIHWTIRKYIDSRENICGLGYDDAPIPELTDRKISRKLE